MRHEITCLLLLLLFSAPLFALEPQNIDSMNAQVTLERTIGSDLPITEATFLTYEFPVDTVKEYDEYEKEPDDFGNTFVKMSWEDATDMSYSISMDVETGPVSLVESSPKFPAKYDGLDQYLAAGEYTPINSGIRKKANEIVHGSDTVFEATAKLALWVHQNIEYDTLYGGRVDSSADTFEKRRGTCDEFSHLFIAMARAVGIPARYVSGITYGTFGIESGGSADWYAHGWAEVYIGRWVSFDPTYGEIGYVDGTHIKIAHAPDQKDLESYITWRPDSSRVSLDTLEHKIDVTGSTNFSDPLQKVSMELTPDEIGVGEYALAKITSTPRGCNGQGLKFVYSDKNAETLDLSLAMGESFMMTIGCGEPIVEYIVVESPASLEKGYSYTYEVLAYNSQDEVRKKLTVNPRLEAPPSAELFLDRLSVKPAESLKVRASIEVGEPVTAYLFDDEGLIAEENVKAGQANLTWSLSDGEPGLHNLYLYVPRALAKASYSVENGGPLSVEITGPNTIEPGNKSWYEVTVGGELYTEATVTFDLFTTQTQVVTLTGTAPEALSFVVDIPETAQATVYASAQAISPGTSAQAVKEISVYHKPVQKSEEAQEKVSGILAQLIDNIKYFIRQLLKKF